jgi:hypothetical protein
LAIVTQKHRPPVMMMMLIAITVVVTFVLTARVPPVTLRAVLVVIGPSAQRNGRSRRPHRPQQTEN